MFKLKFVYHAIGDQICTTAIPENIFKMTGQKCVVTDPRIWAFKHNPYVIHGMSEAEASKLPEITLMPDARIKEQIEHFSKVRNSYVTSNPTEYMCVNIGIKNIDLRHPRLYIHEDVEIIPNKITVHTTGSDRSREGSENIRAWAGEDALKQMTDDIIDAVMRNYKGYEIVQIGGKNDVPLKGNFIDKRGLDIWDTAKEVASSSRFIGVNSGMTQIANCYPRVDKRVFMTEFPREVLMAHKAGDIRNFSFSWFDSSHIFFNRFEYDAGETYSYLKI